MKDKGRILGLAGGQSNILPQGNEVRTVDRTLTVILLHPPQYLTHVSTYYTYVTHNFIIYYYIHYDTNNDRKGEK